MCESDAEMKRQGEKPRWSLYIWTCGWSIFHVAVVLYDVFVQTI